MLNSKLVTVRPKRDKFHIKAQLQILTFINQRALYTLYFVLLRSIILELFDLML